ncbi:predicted protein [Chaetoceros tenuissimus]|uniref:Superoxide dismutase copper/zinc binding domain-containing protein n=1 Tax=Chaetoceros tenuissimus TaxID=426638 RepID=A0AAD3H8A5_9STRA|nr:predicted protein [Chaetoceros tenuissimus]
MMISKVFTNVPIAIMLLVAAMIPSSFAKSLRNVEENGRRRLQQSSTSEYSSKPILHAYMEPVQTQRWDSFSNDDASSSSSSNVSTYAGVTLTFHSKDSDMMDINYFVKGGPSNCKDCLVSIHKGDSCSSPNVRYFKKSDKVRRNPWTKKGGATISTNGEGKGVGTIESFSNGLSHEENEGHVVVIYSNARVNASRRSRRAKVVACGVLKNISVGTTRSAGI